jgi:hypothetical protein
VIILRVLNEPIAGKFVLNRLIKKVRKIIIFNYSDQNLVNPCTSVPDAVEILNLSGNEITIIKSPVQSDCLKV